MEFDITPDGLLLRGKLLIDQAEFLRGMLKEQLKNSSEVIHIDISEVSVMDTATVQLLFSAKKSARLMNKEIIIQKPNETVRQVIHLTGLSTAFSINDQ